MQRLLFLLLVALTFSLPLFASNVTTQEHLVSLSPEKGADSVRTKAQVKVTFDREIVESSVNKHTIILKPINPKGKRVSADVTLENKSTLVLTPNELLKEGEYRVRVNPLRLKADKDDYQLSSFMKKLLYWLCSWFYDDISECPLYKRFYTIPHFIKTQPIQYTFSVVDRPEILKIKLNTTSLDLNETETTQLKAVATYDDNTTKDVSKEVTWSIDNPSVASIDTNATLTALQEGTAQITATLENITSQTLSLSVAKVINGHRLPPMPDKTLNDSTLLGIDVNNNGVRDDVERWIYETYTEPVEIGLFMQRARAYQKIIIDPSKANETVKYSDDVLSCEFYWEYEAENNNEIYHLDEYRDMSKEIKPIQFNTIKRHISYKKYNAEFNGEVLSAPKASKDKCEFDENGILKGL